MKKNTKAFIFSVFLFVLIIALTAILYLKRSDDKEFIFDVFPQNTTSTPVVIEKNLQQLLDESTWVTTSTCDGKVSFSYPDKAVDINGINNDNNVIALYLIGCDSRQHWLDSVKKWKEDYPEAKVGECYGIGDPNCFPWDWDANKKMYEQFLAGKAKTIGSVGFENATIFSKLEKFSNINYIKNFECNFPKNAPPTISYTTYISNNHFSFAFFVTESQKDFRGDDLYGVEKDVCENDPRLDVEREKYAVDILNGTLPKYNPMSLNNSIIESVMSTVKIKR